VTRRRFLADELHGDTAVLTGQNAAHLARVLRARVGQEYEIAGEGTVRIGKITIVEDDRVEFALGSPIASPTTVPVTLLVAIFKFDRFEWAVEKATELGVATIVPVIARRTDAHLAQAAAKRLDRWRRIAHEASQQSRRVNPPEISEPRKLKDAIAAISGLKIVLAESENDTMLRDVLAAQAGMPVPHNSITLAVGPEGGWTEDELQLFAKHEWISTSLGPTILRAETAAIAGLAVVGVCAG
jgi:16S rRNA (uracil1498-N3)-methyltransferase